MRFPCSKYKINSNIPCYLHRRLNFNRTNLLRNYLALLYFLIKFTSILYNNLSLNNSTHILPTLNLTHDKRETKIPITPPTPPRLAFLSYLLLEKLHSSSLSTLSFHHRTGERNSNQLVSPRGTERDRYTTAVRAYIYLYSAFIGAAV